jgi:hypothetical protein
MDVNTLLDALYASWGEDTAYNGHWEESLPETGQCAVTALVVQDFLGGDVVRVKAGHTSHYFNILPDGARVDLTAGQFGGIRLPWSAPEVRGRKALLRVPHVKARYGVLAGRVRQYLADEVS